MKNDGIKSPYLKVQRENVIIHRMNEIERKRKRKVLKKKYRN